MERLTSHEVDDLLPPGNELLVVFLLESPEVNEVIHKHPLAGQSGRTVARWLVDNIEEFHDWSGETPMGCQLKKYAGIYQKVGLMNCSLRPMSKAVYDCSLGLVDQGVVSLLDEIRIASGAISQASPGARLIRRGIIDGLTIRLAALPATTLVVPCGDFARRMALKSRSSTLNVYNGRVPHPSRKRWLSERYRPAMDELKETLNPIFPRACAVQAQ